MEIGFDAFVVVVVGQNRTSTGFVLDEVKRGCEKLSLSGSC